MMQVAITKGRRIGVREVSILELVTWAFQRELASVDLSPNADLGAEPLPSFGMEYVMIQRAMLGCRVDGGGRSPCHPDADAVADALAQLPITRGGREMALRIAELARSGRMPNWRADARPRVEPRDWRNCQYGRFARTESAGVVRYLHRGKVRETEVRFCPIVFRDAPAEVAAARRAYLAWWGALLELRDTFRIYGGLTAHQVTEEMPPSAPWKKQA